MGVHYTWGQEAALMKLGFLSPNVKAILGTGAIGAAGGSLAGFAAAPDDPLQGMGYGALAGGGLAAGGKMLHNLHLDKKIKDIQDAVPKRRAIDEVEAELSPLRQRRQDLRQRIPSMQDAADRAAAEAEEAELLKKIQELNVQKAPYSPEERAAWNANQEVVPQLQERKTRIF